MIKYLITLLTAVSGWMLVSPLAWTAETTPASAGSRAKDPAFQKQMQTAIQRGLTWLQSGQNSNGWWSTPDHPAVTALALTAFMGEPTEGGKRQVAPPLAKGYDFILASVKPDGGIYRAGLANYNTSLCMLALLAAKDAKYEPILRRARAALVALQADPSTLGESNAVFAGGVGYGSNPQQPDLNNTVTALEALYYTRHLVRDQNTPETKDLNWDAAIRFIQNCQNLPTHNQQAWVSEDPKDRGGFIYCPGRSMAGGVTNAATGKVALRSYGTISYAGLLSYIYADLKRDDPRVVAVLDWLRGNYTLEENPGMQMQGLYYYLHLMTKALNLCGADRLELKDGRTIDWRFEIASRLLQLQQHEGSWANTNNRWWEKDPNLVTAYAALSLEMIARGGR